MPKVTKRDDTIERVELVQDLIATFQSGVQPDDGALKRASELGIDVEKMREAYSDSEDSDSGYY